MTDVNGMYGLKIMNIGIDEKAVSSEMALLLCPEVCEKCVTNGE